MLNTAVVPPMPGLDRIPYLTNSSLMDLDAVPRHLLIIGGSYVGLEFGQMFRRFGSEVTIIGNFLLQERFVFQDMRADAAGTWTRFAKSFAFNNVEAIVRIPVIALLVNTWHLSSVIAAAITLIVAFVVRFMFHSLVVYAPRRAGAPSAARELVDEIDAQLMSPGEL